MATILDVFYSINGVPMSLEEIRKINPYASKDWLGNTANFSNTRRLPIIKLFDGKDRVTADEIKLANRKTGSKTSKNFGEYPAFRAIAHGMAKHDGNKGLIKIDSKFWDGIEKYTPPCDQPRMRSMLSQPSANDFDSAWNELRNEDNENPDVDEVFDRIEERWTEEGWQLPQGWRTVLENALKKRQ